MQIVQYDEVQFTKTEAVLRGMGLDLSQLATGPLRLAIGTQTARVDVTTDGVMPENLGFGAQQLFRAPTVFNYYPADYTLAGGNIGRAFRQLRVGPAAYADVAPLSTRQQFEIVKAHGAVRSPSHFRHRNTTRTSEQVIYQFHPEVAHTPRGREIIRNFLYEICHCAMDWTMGSFIDPERQAAVRRVEEVLDGRDGVFAARWSATLAERWGDLDQSVLVVRPAIAPGRARTLVDPHRTTGDSTAAIETPRRRHSWRKNRKYSSPIGDHGLTTATRR